jgi:hypothetical protein
MQRKLTKGQVRIEDKANLKLKLNLKEILGLDVSRNEGLKRALGERFLRRIQERTEENTSRTGKTFKKYSDVYVDSLDFKAAGKSEDDVNLKLTGDMLGLMQVNAKDNSNIVEISWESDNERAKAFNHVTGDTVPKRDFFGLPSIDVKEIKNEFRSEIRDIKRSRGRNRDTAILNLIKRIESAFDDGEN